MPFWQLKSNMSYNLRTRKARKDFLPLLYYRLLSDILLLIAEHAAVRKRHTYNLRGK